jgi:hypothetical protein
LRNTAGLTSPALYVKEVALMKRILLVLAVMAVLMLALAAPAFASNFGPKGPPSTSGFGAGNSGQGNEGGATVIHCNSPQTDLGTGTVVFTKNGEHGTFANVGC